MTIKSMDAANRRLLLSSIDFIKIPAQPAQGKECKIKTYLNIL